MLKAPIAAEMKIIAVTGPYFVPSLHPSVLHVKHGFHSVPPGEIAHALFWSAQSRSTISPETNKKTKQ